jgi:hypothetical protein
MRCFGYGSERCDEPGTIPDPEAAAVFVNPEDPQGPRVQPAHCQAHHDRIMRARAENEASWRRSLGNQRR